MGFRANGASKNTTMKIITGYITADGGNATVCSIPVNENSNETKTKLVTAGSQPLYYDMYVREYLEFIGKTYIKWKV